MSTAAGPIVPVTTGSDVDLFAVSVRTTLEVTAGSLLCVGALRRWNPQHHGTELAASAPCRWLREGAKYRTRVCAAGIGRRGTEAERRDRFRARRSAISEAVRLRLAPVSCARCSRRGFRRCAVFEVDPGFRRDDLPLRGRSLARVALAE